jgi:hypothetical protein
MEIRLSRGVFTFCYQITAERVTVGSRFANAKLPTNCDKKCFLDRWEWTARKKRLAKLTKLGQSIVIIDLSSLQRHYQKHHVNWTAVKYLGLGFITRVYMPATRETIVNNSKEIPSKYRDRRTHHRF